MDILQPSHTPIAPDNVTEIPFEQKISPENIPEELKEIPNWVLWKMEPRIGKDGNPVYNEDGTPKMTKVPYQINGKKAKPNDPKTWNTFSEVIRIFGNERECYSGIGFVVSTGTGIVAIDFDHVRDAATGEWNKEAWKEIQELNSYTELSPSGTGCHVFVKGEMVEDGRRKKQPDGTDREMYQNLHFLTVTGNKVDGLPDTVNEAQAKINTFFYVWFQQTLRSWERQESGERKEKFEDYEIIEMASCAANRSKFKKLRYGDIEGYPSHSEADLAFCSMLSFYTQDKEQIERIFRESGLYREEKGTDYLKRTIDTALRGQKTTYNPERNKAKSKHRREEEGEKGKGNKKENEESEPEDPVSTYPERIQNYAYKLLREGDPFAFMMETWSLRHVGDRNVGENCLCAVASTYILNSNGIHIKPSGDSGKGKSDGMETALLLLPPSKYIKGSISAKNLFYDESLTDGLIVYSDDVHLNDDMISTVKQSTSIFQEPKLHRTLVNQTATNLYLPARISWLFSSVDGFSDEQLTNRFLNCDVDGSREQDIRVLNHIKDTEEMDWMPDSDDLLICRCMFDILDREKYTIKVPYIKAIDWRNPENRRNFKKFLDIIRSVTFFKVLQKEKIKGYYLAEYEDYERAREIYKGTAKHNATNLTDRELQVLQFIVGKNRYDGNGDLILEAEVETDQIMKKFELSQSRVHQILHGKEGKGGMLAKIPNLSRIEKTESAGDEKKTTRKKNAYVYRGKKLGLEIYDSVATLDKEAATQATEEFIKSITGESITPITPLLPHYYPTEVIVKSSIEDRINNNITSNSSNERERENKKSPLTVFKEQSKGDGSKIEDSSRKKGNRVIDNSNGATDKDLSITSQGNSRVIAGNSRVIEVFGAQTNTGEEEEEGKEVCRAAGVAQVAGIVPKVATVATIKDEMENIKKLKFLRKDLETQYRTYARKRGGVENLGEFVEEFLSKNIGFRNSWAFDTIMSEAEKVCKKIPSGSKKVVDQENSGEVDSIVEG